MSRKTKSCTGSYDIQVMNDTRRPPTSAGIKVSREIISEDETFNLRKYYSKGVMEALEEMLDIETETKRAQIGKIYSLNEVFEAILEYEGILGYGTKIRGWIKEIYGIDLDKVEV